MGPAGVVGPVGTFLLGFGLFVGVPAGVVGYAAGLAVHADATAGADGAPTSRLC